MKKYSKSLLGGSGNAKENRRLLHFWARFIISISNAVTFLALLYLLFFAEVKETSRDLVNILVGAYVAVWRKVQIIGIKIKKNLRRNINAY